MYYHHPLCTYTLCSTLRVTNATLTDKTIFPSYGPSRCCRLWFFVPNFRSLPIGWFILIFNWIRSLLYFDIPTYEVVHFVTNVGMPSSSALTTPTSFYPCYYHTVLNSRSLFTLPLSISLSIYIVSLYFLPHFSRQFSVLIFSWTLSFVYSFNSQSLLIAPCGGGWILDMTQRYTNVFLLWVEFLFIYLFYSIWIFSSLLVWLWKSRHFQSQLFLVKDTRWNRSGVYSQLQQLVLYSSYEGRIFVLFCLGSW